MNKLPGSKNEIKEKRTTVPHYKSANQAPVTASDGSAKRNIIRRHGSGGVERKQAVSKYVANDGSLDEVVSTLDDKDPNYVGDDPLVVSNHE